MPPPARTVEGGRVQAKADRPRGTHCDGTPRTKEEVFVMSRERRRLFQEEESMAEPGRYGCPMLARARRFSPIQENETQWRCSLGWALRGELDVACYLATESATD